MVAEKALPHMNMALKNVNTLLQLTTNLINFERIDVYSSTLYVSEYELNSYMNDVCATFRKYAEMKRVRFVYESNFDYLNVWFDSDKMGSILKNILSNALKYTPENGSVCICACEEGNTWSIEVKDTGIGIPSSEQKKLFRNCFRGSNVVNLKVTGSGIGLMLVYNWLSCIKERSIFKVLNIREHACKLLSRREIPICIKQSLSLQKRRMNVWMPLYWGNF
mgnify:FL=1